MHLKHLLRTCCELYCISFATHKVTVPQKSQTRFRRCRRTRDQICYQLIRFKTFAYEVLLPKETFFLDKPTNIILHIVSRHRAEHLPGLAELRKATHRISLPRLPCRDHTVPLVVHMTNHIRTKRLFSPKGHNLFKNANLVSLATENVGHHVFQR